MDFVKVAFRIAIRSAPSCCLSSVRILFRELSASDITSPLGDDADRELLGAELPTDTTTGNSDNTTNTTASERPQR